MYPIQTGIMDSIWTNIFSRMPISTITYKQLTKTFSKWLNLKKYPGKLHQSALFMLLYLNLILTIRNTATKTILYINCTGVFSLIPVLSATLWTRVQLIIYSGVLHVWPCVEPLIMNKISLKLWTFQRVLFGHKMHIPGTNEIILARSQILSFQTFILDHSMSLYQ